MAEHKLHSGEKYWCWAQDNSGRLYCSICSPQSLSEKALCAYRFASCQG